MSVIGASSVGSWSLVIPSYHTGAAPFQYSVRPTRITYVNILTTFANKPGDLTTPITSNILSDHFSEILCALFMRPAKVPYIADMISPTTNEIMNTGMHLSEMSS